MLSLNIPECLSIVYLAGACILELKTMGNCFFFIKFSLIFHYWSKLEESSRLICSWSFSALALLLLSIYGIAVHGMDYTVQTRRFCFSLYYYKAHNVLGLLVKSILVSLMVVLDYPWNSCSPIVVHNFFFWFFFSPVESRILLIFR